MADSTPAKSEAESSEAEQAAPVANAKLSECKDSDTTRRLWEVTGGKRGYAPHAYALLPTSDGRFVAVHLEKVTFARAMPADDGGVLATFLPEHMGKALSRIHLAIRLRSRRRREGGWHSKNATR